MNHIEQIQNLIKRLEQIRENPTAEIGSRAITAQVFLDGFANAAVAAGLSHDYDAIRRVVQKERGWGRSSNLIMVMGEQGWSEGRMVNELLDIQLLTWRRILKDISQARA